MHRNPLGANCALDANTQPTPMLIRILLEPRSALDLGERDWYQLLLQARQQGMAAKLAARLSAAGIFDQAPFKARSHMHAASIAALSSQVAVRFEVNRILRALRGHDVPIVLMKGAAYVHAGLPPAAGRFVGDVDLMVPRTCIAEVEHALLAQGWAAAELDAYDQRYYREWTHEIPPMQHPERDTPVDIHHTIAALTSRVHPDAEAILAASLPLADPRLRVMAPADMVLHSAVHLFNDEVSMPLRDLFDLHDLLAHFGNQLGFWDNLLARAPEHGLQRVLYHVLDHTRASLGTPIPEPVLSAVRGWAPRWPTRPLIRTLLHQHFIPDATAGPSPGKQFSSWLLYLRAHWLRMPPSLLVRHLWVKAWKRRRDSAFAARAG